MLSMTNWRVALFYITIAYIVGVLIFGFFAYDSRALSAHGLPVRDGLGRQLFPAPWYVRYFFGSDAYWAGAKWFWAENFVFWTCNAILFVLHSREPEAS
jgi:hypothetical protein